MKSTFMRLVGRLLIVAMLALPMSPVHAGMIGTDQVTAAGTAQSARANLISSMERPDVAGKLQALGVDAGNAKARVAAMTDAEVSSLAHHINALPAGADSGWGWAILIALAIWAWYSYR